MRELGSKLKKLSYLLTAAVFVTLLTYGILAEKGPTIAIGAKNCTEQNILGELLAQLIEEKTDLKVMRKFNLEGTMISFNALNSGTVDVYFEYTGTALLGILNEQIPEEDLYEYVSRVFEERYNLIWMNCLGFSNHYAIITTNTNPINTISEVTPDMNIALDPEFSTRLELNLLKERYDIEWKHTIMDPVMLYFSLLNGEIKIMDGYSTAGRLADSRFKVLQDDRGAMPRYEVAPVIRKKTIERYPELREIFALLEGKISEEEMCTLNYAAEKGEQNIPEIVRQWLGHHQLL